MILLPLPLLPIPAPPPPPSSSSSSSSLVTDSLAQFRALLSPTVDDLVLHFANLDSAVEVLFPEETLLSTTGDGETEAFRTADSEAAVLKRFSLWSI